MVQEISIKQYDVRDLFMNPSKIQWDLTNVSLSKLLELLDTQVWGVPSVGPVGDVLEWMFSSHPIWSTLGTDCILWLTSWLVNLPPPLTKVPPPRNKALLRALLTIGFP